MTLAPKWVTSLRNGTLPPLPWQVHLGWVQLIVLAYSVTDDAAKHRRGHENTHFVRGARMSSPFSLSTSSLFSCLLVSDKGGGGAGSRVSTASENSLHLACLAASQVSWAGLPADDQGSPLCMPSCTYYIRVPASGTLIAPGTVPTLRGQQTHSTRSPRAIPLRARSAASPIRYMHHVQVQSESDTICCGAQASEVALYVDGMPQ